MKKPAERGGLLGGDGLGACGAPRSSLTSTGPASDGLRRDGDAPCYCRVTGRCRTCLSWAARIRLAELQRILREVE